MLLSDNLLVWSVTMRILIVSIFSAQFGTIYLISGSVASIEWTDFNLANFEDPLKPQTIQFGGQFNWGVKSCELTDDLKYLFIDFSGQDEFQG